MSATKDHLKTVTNSCKSIAKEAPELWSPAPPNRDLTTNASKALAVHNRWAGLVILAFGNPHLLERAQRGKDGAPDPHRVFSLGWCNNLDLHRGRRQGCQLLRHALADSCEHRRSTGKHHVGVQVLSDIHITLHDRLERGIVNAAGLLADEAGLEQDFGAPETLAAHSDNVSVRELVRFLFVRAFGGRLHLRVEIKCDVSQLPM